RGVKPKIREPIEDQCGESETREGAEPPDEETCRLLVASPARLARASLQREFPQRSTLRSSKFPGAGGARCFSGARASQERLDWRYARLEARFVPGRPAACKMPDHDVATASRGRNDEETNTPLAVEP